MNKYVFLKCVCDFVLVYLVLFLTCFINTQFFLFMTLYSCAYVYFVVRCLVLMNIVCFRVLNNRAMRDG